MKKIKLLLGIGLLGSLFSTCFGNDYRFFNIEYFSATNQYQNYILNGVNANTWNMTYYDGNWTGVSSFYRYNHSTLDNSLLDISNYTLTGKVSLNSVNPYLFVQDSTKLSLLYRSTNSSYGSYLFPLVSGVNSVDSSFGVFSGLYVRIFSDMANCIVANPVSNPVINGGCSDSSRVFVHYNTKTYDSSRGLIRDLAYGDGDWYKGSISSSVGNTYSFSVGINPIITGNDAYINDSDFVGFRTVVPTLTGDYIFYDNLYLVRLNNLESVLDFSDFQVLAILFTGNSDDTFDFLYSIYNCPYSADDISDCSFSEGGNILPSDLDNSFSSFSGSLYSGGIHFSSSISNARLYYILENFLFFLSLPANYNDLYLSLSYKVFTSYNDSSNIVNFSRPGKTQGSYFYTYSYSAFLDSSANINVLDGILGNGTQSTGSIAINTGLLNACLNDLTFGELNSYLCNQLLANLGNPIQIPGTSGQYISVSIDENGNLRYWITTQEDLEEQMSGFVWVENDDGTRSTVCPSGTCGLSVFTQPINHGNTGSFELTTGDVADMMTNLTGWIGRCPFPYTDFRLGKNTYLVEILQRYGVKYDPFIFVNCAVAGFHYGRHIIDFRLFDDTFEHPLLYGDSVKHRSLFAFLDFIVILGLFGLIAFLKKIF